MHCVTHCDPLQLPRFSMLCSLLFAAVLCFEGLQGSTWRDGEMRRAGVHDVKLTKKKKNQKKSLEKIAKINLYKLVTRNSHLSFPHNSFGKPCASAPLAAVISLPVSPQETEEAFTVGRAHRLRPLC